MLSSSTAFFLFYLLSLFLSLRCVARPNGFIWAGTAQGLSFLWLPIPFVFHTKKRHRAAYRMFSGARFARPTSSCKGKKTISVIKGHFPLVVVRYLGGQVDRPATAFYTAVSRLIYFCPCYLVVVFSFFVAKSNNTTCCPLCC